MTDDGSGELLKDACDQVINDPDLQPSNGVTHCNAGALLVAQAMGCEEFNSPDGEEPLLADAMILLMQMNVSGLWSMVSGSDATIHALGGGLAFAAMSSAELGEEHGHLATIYPTGMQYSPSLKHDVPLVANCGKRNGEEKVSEAFPVAHGEPSYYKWAGPAA